MNKPRKCILCGYLVDWQSEHFFCSGYWYHASCTVKQIGKLDAIIDQLQDEISNHEEELNERESWAKARGYEAGVKGGWW